MSFRHDCLLRVFNKLGLKSSYALLKLAKKSRFMRALVTDFGVFQSCCIPFGISSGPAAHQKVLTSISAGIDGVLAFILAGIDDVVNF